MDGWAGKAWENPANWTCGNIPDANTELVIQNTTNIPEVSSNATCRSTTINPGTSNRVKSGFKLVITH